MSKLPMPGIKKNGFLGPIDMSKVDDTSLAGDDTYKHDIFEHLEAIATDYAALARALRINIPDMKSLEMQCANSPKRAVSCLAGVIELYLEKMYNDKYEEPTWKGIVYAVYKVKPVLARQLADIHLALPATSPVEESPAAHFNVQDNPLNDPLETAPNSQQRLTGQQRHSDSFLDQLHHTEQKARHGRKHTFSAPSTNLSRDQLPEATQGGPPPPSYVKMTIISEQPCVSRSQMVVPSPSARPRGAELEQTDTHKQDDDVVKPNPPHGLPHQTSNPEKNTQPPVPVPNRSISSPPQATPPTRSPRGRARGTPVGRSRRKNPSSDAKVGKSRTMAQDTPPQSRAAVNKFSPPTERSSETTSTQSKVPPVATGQTPPQGDNTQFGTPPSASRMLQKVAASKEMRVDKIESKDLLEKASKYLQHEHHEEHEHHEDNPPPTNTPPMAEPKFFAHMPLPAAAAGAPPVATASYSQQSGVTEYQSYSTGQSFSGGQQPTFQSSLSNEDSLTSHEDSVTSHEDSLTSLSNTESTLDSNREQESLLSHSEEESVAKSSAACTGNSVVASVQSKSDKACFVSGRGIAAPMTFENSSLVSSAVPVASDKEASLVYQGKVQKEHTFVPPMTSDPTEQVPMATGGDVPAKPQLVIRKGNSIASSQGVDHLGGNRGSPKTMDLITEDEVRLKPSHFQTPPPRLAVTKETEPPKQEDDTNHIIHPEPVSSASTMQHENLAPTRYQEGDSFTPSEAGGSTKHEQCTSMPPGDGSPRQPAKTGDHEATRLDSLRETRPAPGGNPLTPSQVGGSTQHGPCSSLGDGSPRQPAKTGGLGATRMPEARPSDGTSNQPHQEEEDGPFVELKYATLQPKSHTPSSRDTESDGVRFHQSFEAIVTKEGRPRFKKIELSFDSLSPNVAAREIPADEVEDYYQMKNTPHGLAIIVNNEHFERHNRREGTAVDEKNLVTTLCYLGYNVEVYRNLTKQEIGDLFEEIKKRDHSSSDSFLCCILTHGESGHLIAADSYSVPIKSLTENLCASNCPQLTGKPKIFFIQACRGSETCREVAMDGQEVGDDHRDNSGAENEHEVDGGVSPDYPIPVCRLKRAISRSLSLDLDPSGRVQPDSTLIPNVADFIFGYATPSGQVSWRDLDHGSWYISELCRQLCMFCGTKSLLDIMTKVHHDVGDLYSHKECKQAPETIHRLRKKVLF